MDAMQEKLMSAYESNGLSYATAACGRTRTVESLVSRRPFNDPHHLLDLARFQVTIR